MAENLSLVTTRYGTIITAVGKAKISAAIHGGKKVNIVRAAVGDGGGAYYKPTDDQTALIHECWRGEIAYWQVNEVTPNMIDLKFVIPAEVGGFTIREGVAIDEDGDVIAIWNTPAVEKPSIEEGASLPLTMMSHLLVEDAEAVTVTINPSLDTVSREEMEAALAEYAAGVGSAIIREITIPAEAWVETPEGDEGYGLYTYTATVALQEATEDHVPGFALALASLAPAGKAGMCRTANAFDGYVQFWAKRIPSETVYAEEDGESVATTTPVDLAGTLTLRSENMMYTGGSGAGGDVATDDDVRDAVEDVFGDPSTVIPTTATIATDEEVANKVTGIFGE